MNHKEGQTVRVYTHDGKFIGLYMFIADKQIYKPIKMFCKFENRRRYAVYIY